MWAARYGHSDTVKLLLKAGASIEAKNNVSKRISLCTCVCVIFLHHRVVLSYSYILLLWYVGYDDFISMSNVFVIVLIIIIFCLCRRLLIWSLIFLRNPLFFISDKLLFFVCLFSGVFILSQTLTLILFFVLRFNRGACL